MSKGPAQGTRAKAPAGECRAYGGEGATGDGPGTGSCTTYVVEKGRTDRCNNCQSTPAVKRETLLGFHFSPGSLSFCASREKAWWVGGSACQDSPLKRWCLSRPRQQSWEYIGKSLSNVRATTPTPLLAAGKPLCGENGVGVTTNAKEVRYFRHHRTRSTSTSISSFQTAVFTISLHAFFSFL